MSSSDPQMLISSCAAGVCKLAKTQAYLQKAFAALAARSIRIDAFTRRNDADQWSAISTGYQHVVEQSEHSAVKLAAAIKVYVSLQQDITDAETDDMIVELSALKTHVAGYDFDQHAALAGLIARATHLKQQQEQAVEARRASVGLKMLDAGREVDACKARLEELYRQHAAASEAILRESKSTMSAYYPGRRSNSLPLPQASGSSGAPAEFTGQHRKQSRSQKSLDVQAQVSAHKKKIRELENQMELLRGALADSQDRLAKAKAALQTFERADWEATHSAMESVIVYLAKHDKRSGALVELRKQLLNEVDAYQLAFQSMKNYPGPTRQAALSRMQERVGSTAPAWKSIAALLANEYAKGRKSA